MKRNSITAAFKKAVSAAVAAVMVLGCAATVSAGNFDDFYDYENPDGTFTYYFTQGVFVTLDKDWYEKTIVIPEELGASFYHKKSYYAYQGEGYEGGRLFTISASVNTDFKNLPSFEYIGFDEKECMNYFAILPTDYQAYAADDSISAEYNELWEDVKDVIAGIRLENGSADSSGDAGSSEDEAADSTGSSEDGDLFTRVSRDEFSFEVPSSWDSWTLDDPDTLFASKDGSDKPPVFFAQKLGNEVSAGDCTKELKQSFLDTYGEGIVTEPEIITYQPEDTERELAGFRGVYNSKDGSREYTVLEYLEYFGDDLYHYYCCYMSGTTVDGEHEDENTYFEFQHAIDTMVVE